jgi:hypothetical protein
MRKRYKKVGTRRNGLPSIAIMLLGMIVALLMWAYYISE